MAFLLQYAKVVKLFPFKSKYAIIGTTFRQCSSSSSSGSSTSSTNILPEQQQQHQQQNNNYSTKIFKMNKKKGSRDGLGKPKGYYDTETRYILEHGLKSGKPDKIMSNQPFLGQ
jgi:hypothetical protein